MLYIAGNKDELATKLNTVVKDNPHFKILCKISPVPFDYGK